MNHVIIAKFIDRLGQQEPSEELNFTQESRNQENPQTFSCLPETHAAAARRAKNLSLTVGRGDGELLGDGEVGEEHEEEPQQEPDAEVLLRRALHALDELPRIAPHLPRLRRVKAPLFLLHLSARRRLPL